METFSYGNPKSNPRGLRVVRTARDEAGINEAARNGFRPLVKRVKPSRHIHQKFCVLQHRETGEIEVHSDFRSGWYPPKESAWKRVIDWTNYYPYQFPAPFVAYLLPPDLQVGERVWLEDLIEDIVGSTWNQGDAYRLESAEAVWNGRDFEIDGNETKETIVTLG